MRISDWSSDVCSSDLERERDGAEPELEKPVAAPRLQVVVALRGGAGDQLDLPLVEAEALIGGPRLWLDRPVVGQEDALRAALDDGRRDGAAGDIGERLRGEDDGDVLLAQHLQPFADARGDDRVVDIDPGFVQKDRKRVGKGKGGSIRVNP